MSNCSNKNNVAHVLCPSIKKTFLLYVYVCLGKRMPCVWVAAGARRGCRVPRAGDGCGPPYMGVRNRAQVFWRSMAGSQPLCHRSGSSQPCLWQTSSLLEPPWLSFSKINVKQWKSLSEWLFKYRGVDMRRQRAKCGDWYYSSDPKGGERMNLNYNRILLDRMSFLSLICFISWYLIFILLYGTEDGN